MNSQKRKTSTVERKFEDRRSERTEIKDYDHDKYKQSEKEMKESGMSGFIPCRKNNQITSYVHFLLYISD